MRPTLRRIAAPPWAAALITAAVLAGADAAHADDGDTHPAPADPPFSGLRLQIGSTLQPAQPTHDVQIRSDSEGTRVLAVDTSSLLGVGDVGTAGARQQ